MALDFLLGLICYCSIRRIADIFAHYGMHSFVTAVYFLMSLSVPVC